MSMDELVARLEAASEGSEQLDAEIALAAGLRHRRDLGDSHKTWRAPGSPVYSGSFKPPAYTTSLDAALQLAPEGMLPTVGPTFKQGDRDGHWWYAKMKQISRNIISPLEWTGAWGKTAPLAMSAAALKARSAGND